MNISSCPPECGHDKTAAGSFLSFLGRETFVFQFLADSGSRPGGCPPTYYGNLEQAWPLITRWNTPAHNVGVFATVNPTRGERRRAQDITAVSALFIDADGPEQTKSAIEAMKGRPPPGMIVRTSRGLHAYYKVCDVQPCEFSRLQRVMAAHFGTDPNVCDLPRVMRLPGTFHLKASPYLVTVRFPR